MPTFVLVDSDGVIRNRVLANTISDVVAPTGLSASADPQETFKIGGTLINGVYTPPVDPAPPAPLDTFDSWDRVSAGIAFNHENRIRALEGKAALTAAQFKAAVKAQIT